MREFHGKKHREAVCDTRLTRGAWRSIRVGIRHRQGNLRHNIEACAPSRTTSPLLLLIPSRMKRKAPTTPALASAARYAAGRPAKTTAGLALVGMNGTLSIREECAPLAFINGLRRSVSSVVAGRRTRTGMRLREKEETVK
jgi:hypothetical protein